tara:strand:- start:116 stop:2206 length:2091 start_codon:yes stop_codon:yes gene_type:complete
MINSPFFFNRYKFILSTVLISISSLQAQNILLSEDFDGIEISNDWGQETLASDGGWIIGDNSILQSEWWTIEPHGNFVATNDDQCDCDKSADYLILPSLNLIGVEVPLLSFSSFFSGESFQGNTESATIEYSLNGGGNWTVLQNIEGNGNSNNTVWETQSVNLIELVGNESVLIALVYNDGGGWMFGWGIDDILVYEPEGLDAELSSLSLPQNVVSNSEISIQGVINNLGTELIESANVTWIFENQEYTQLFSNLDLSLGESFEFTHQDVFIPSSTGNYEIEVIVSNINSSLDGNLSNNTITSSVMVVEHGTILLDNYEREYIYYHPQNAEENCPLVFVCHGYSGTAEEIMNYSEFNLLADQYGFAVCYPQGIQDANGSTFFNVGYDFQNNETVDDVSFLEELTSDFVAMNSIDSNKVFCTGMSNGGDLCYLLACEASETFAAVAPVSGMILQDIMNDCSPTNSVSILEIHGTQDNITYFEGDPQNQDGWGAYPSIPATVNFFTELYGLELLSSGLFPNLYPNDGSDVSYDKYGLENSCAEVWLYTVNQGGHDWPGSFGNMDINASLQAWLFFDQLCSSSVITGEDIEGCSDQYALNYNMEATIDDSSCVYQDIPDCDNMSITLLNGWNMIGFSCSTNTNASIVFAPIQDDIIIVKDGIGNAYLPDWDFNGIGDLTRGFGYLIKVTEEISDYNICE